MKETVEVPWKTSGPVGDQHREMDFAAIGVTIKDGDVVVEIEDKGDTTVVEITRAPVPAAG